VVRVKPLSVVPVKLVITVLNHLLLLLHLFVLLVRTRLLLIFMKLRNVFRVLLVVTAPLLQPQCSYVLLDRIVLPTIHLTLVAPLAPVGPYVHRVTVNLLCVVLVCIPMIAKILVIIVPPVTTVAVSLPATLT